MTEYFNENDPESIMDAEREEQRDAETDITIEEYWAADPFYDWYAPGYVTEMDYLNAQEADDYRNEFEDIEF